jgi:hypothetical protein
MKRKYQKTGVYSRGNIKKKISDKRWSNYELVVKVRDKKYKRKPIGNRSPFTKLHFNPEDGEPKIEQCSYPMCGRYLTPRESLFGSRCIKHSEPGQTIY